MLLDLADRRDVLFVGGKGGVGKTAVASAVALATAREGRRALIVSTDPAHNLGHLWRCPVGDDPVELAPLLRGVEIDPQRTTDAHLDRVRRTMHRLMPERLSGEIRAHLEIARDAPGTHEAAVVERIAEVVEQREEDELLVFDTAQSGYTARLTALPEMMQAWTDGLLSRHERSEDFTAALSELDRDDHPAPAVIGSQRTAVDTDTRAAHGAEITEVLNRRRSRFAALRGTLQDRNRTGSVIVLAAERLAVLETAELHAQLTRAGMPVDALVVNKRSPADSGPLLEARRAQEEWYLAQLRSLLGALPTVEVPLLATDVLGAEGLATFAEHLR